MHVKFEELIKNKDNKLTVIEGNLIEDHHMPYICLDEEEKRNCAIVSKEMARITQLL